MKIFMLAVIAVCLAVSSQGQVIKIATCSPLSGSQGSLGEMIKLGAQLAMEQNQESLSKAGLWR